MKPLILGYGKLGKEIVKQTNWKYISRKNENFDFLDIKTYIDYLLYYDTIINCIADTNTYSTNKTSHWNLNFKGVIDLVDICNQLNKKIVHISTDYIYSNSDQPALEDETVPVHCNNWYGYTKLLGDGYVQAKAKKYLLIRCSFKETPFQYESALINQIGNFDYTPVIAEKIIKLINKNSFGVFNVGTKTKTMYELALRTKKDVKKLEHMIHATTPKFIVMNLQKMRKELGE